MASEAAPAALPATMRAVVAMAPGTPDVLELKTDWPRRVPRAGQVSIRVSAFGLNRAELFTRQGDSPGVEFPRVLGIEAVGTVAELGEGVAGSGLGLKVGDTVVTMMGEMGRAYDGGYAEYVCVAAKQALRVATKLEPTVLAAMPETWVTASDSLDTLGPLEAGMTLMIRGGTSALGMAAAQLAKARGLRVIATTRSESRLEVLKVNGADDAMVDTGTIADAVRELVPGGVDRVLELVGTATLLDSLKATARFGVVCMTGILGSSWALDGFAPMSMIPSTVRLTSYDSGTLHDTDDSHARNSAAMQAICDGVEAGRLKPNLDRVFEMAETADAHRYMEANKATGKVVVKVDD